MLWLDGDVAEAEGQIICSDGLPYFTVDYQRSILQTVAEAR